MKNSILSTALNVSVESVESVDRIISDMADEQVMADAPVESQVIEEISHVENDIELLDRVKESIDGDDVSMEQLSHARGIVDSIGLRYGAESTYASMESADDQRLNKELIIEDLQKYRTGLESYATVSMEGFFLGASNLKDIGKNIELMKRTVAVLKSNDIERIKEIKMGRLKLFMKIGGGLPQDLSRAVKEVGRGLELALKYADDTLTAAQRAGEIATKADWSNIDSANRAREQIAALKLNLDKISSDLNGFPMFGNRSFGVTVKGQAGALGDWDKKYSFGSGIPNAGLLRTALFVAGVITVLTVNIAGGAVMLAVAASGKTGTKREIPMKDFATAMEIYSKSAEKVYSQRANAVKKSTVHTKLMNDLKNINGLPKDVRAAIARASSFGWSMSNGVYDVVAHSVSAVAGAGEKLTIR